MGIDMSRHVVAEFFGTFWLVFGAAAPPCWLSLT